MQSGCHRLRSTAFFAWKALEGFLGDLGLCYNEIYKMVNDFRMAGQGKDKMRNRVYIAGIGICLLVFVISAYQVYRYYANGKKHAEEFAELSELVEQTQEELEITVINGMDVLLDYAELYERNSDMAGWISIEGTSIHYPVMYTPENPDFYLKHNFDREYSSWGVPYVAGECNIQKPSDNIIIYGHHIRGRRMFGALLDYSEKSFYESHKKICFHTLAEKAEYEIIAAFKTTVNEGEDFPYYEFVDAKSAEDFQTYVEICKSLAPYDTGITAEYGDKLLTLSTCEYSRTDGRFVVVAKKIVE